MRNILFLSHGANRGGSQNDLVRLMGSLKDLYNCHCIFPADGQVVQDAKDAGVKTTHIIGQEAWMGFNRNNVHKAIALLWKSHTSVAKIVDVIWTHKIDLVITNTIMPVEGAIAAHICRIPHVWVIHELLGRDPKLISLFRLPFLYIFVLILSQYVIVVSQAVKDDIEQQIKDPIGMAYPFTPSDLLEKVVVVYNGIDLSRLPKINRSEHAKDVLSIGGVCRRKGYINLLRAARRVCDMIPDTKFNIVGAVWERDYWGELKQERTRLGLDKQVGLHRYQPDLVPFYEQCGVFVMPSMCESFSMVLLEAMGLRLPIVTTDCGGPREIIEHGESGYVVQTEDPFSMSNCILSILGSHNIANHFTDCAYERVKTQFNYERRTAGFIDIIERCFQK